MEDFLFGQEHVDRYIATDGEEGHDWRNGAPVALLTTKGRKSGEERINPLIYRVHGDDFLLVASKGGTPAPPAWYLNLQADPEAELQVKAEHHKVRARDATPEEKPELWKLMASIWPDYDAYQRNTDREIPVVILEPAG